MTRKQNSYFPLRLSAFIIDFSIIYGVAFIIFNLFQAIHIYLSIAKLTLIIALLYFPIITIALKASLGKAICGLQIKSNKKRQFTITVLLREIVFKQLFYIIPIYIVSSFFKLDWLLPYFELCSVILLSLILFFFFLFVKRTWYDHFSKASIEKNTNYNNYTAKLGFILLVSISIIVFSIRGSYYITTKSFNTPLIPKHSKSVTEPYVSFLTKQKSAKDYIFDLFEKNDIVILCERMHPELTQYDFIHDLISDNRFVENIGNICSEIGSTTQQTNLDSLMNTDSLTTKEFEFKLSKLLQNFSQFPIWEFTNQFKYYSQLYSLNQQLPSHQRIQHFLTDIECNWDNIQNKKDYSFTKSLFYKREKILADNVIRNFEDLKSSGNKRKKCLVIMNYRHAFGYVNNNKQRGDSWQTCASYIMKKYPNNVANVMLNTVKLSFGLSMPDMPPFVVPLQNSAVNDGVWDNAFSTIGDKSLGFDFKDSPFGKSQFDLFFMPSWKKYKYQDIFTGFVFYKPLSEHFFSYGFKNISLNGFYDEIIDRAKRIEDDALDNNLAYWTHKVNRLIKQEVTINTKPYQQLESVFGYVFGTLLLVLGCLLAFKMFMKKRNDSGLEI